MTDYEISQEMIDEIDRLKEMNENTKNGGN